MNQARIITGGFLTVANSIEHNIGENAEVRSIEVVGWNSDNDKITMVTYEVTYIDTDGELKTYTVNAKQ